MGSLHGLSTAHWDHEPLPSKQLAIGNRQSAIGRFMERVKGSFPLQRVRMSNGQSSNQLGPDNRSGGEVPGLCPSRGRPVEFLSSPASLRSLAGCQTPAVGGLAEIARWRAAPRAAPPVAAGGN